MNTNFKIFISALIIIVVAYFLLIRKNSNEHFKSRTNSGKECITWKNAVQYRDYGESKSCKNPESDINGSWCYTDNYGNYEYCNSYDPGCMKMKILEGCFTPDPNAYQLVIYNSQPFGEKYLELDKIVDSTNQIWCLDKTGRYLRTTKKANYVNYQWTDMIGDSFNNYDPSLSSFYFISSFGVKKGGYVDTQKNNKEEEVNSLMASEVCYLFLRNYTSLISNKMMRCILSEQINLQQTNPSYHINIGWGNREREYINLGKKIMLDRNGYIFGIQREKLKSGKGIHWGDMVIGKEDNTGAIKFNLLGDTFPTGGKLNDYEYSAQEEPDTNKSNRRYMVNTNKKLFSNSILKMVHKGIYTLNELLNKKDSTLIENFMNELSGIGNQEQDRGMVEEFQRYLKYRILLNDDFRFKNTDGRVFTYNLILQDGTFNPVFADTDVLSLMNDFPNVKYINYTKDYLDKLNNLKLSLNFKPEYDKFARIEKIDENIDTIDSLNNNGIDNCNNKLCLRNLKYSHRSSSEFTKDMTLKQELDGILNEIKDIPLRNRNLVLKQRLETITTTYQNNVTALKNEFLRSGIYTTYNDTIQYLNEVEDKFNTRKTNTQAKEQFILTQFGPGVNSDFLIKRIYYKVVGKMMAYFKEKTEFIYESIFRSVESIKDIIDTQKDNIISQLRDSSCFEQDRTYGLLSSYNLNPEIIPESERTRHRHSFSWHIETVPNGVPFEKIDRIPLGSNQDFIYLIREGNATFFGNLDRRIFPDRIISPNTTLDMYSIRDTNLIREVTRNINNGTWRLGESTFRTLNSYFNSHIRRMDFLGRGMFDRLNSIFFNKENILNIKTRQNLDMRDRWRNKLLEVYETTFRNNLQEQLNNKLRNKRIEFATIFKDRIEELETLIDPNPRQGVGKMLLNINETQTNLELLNGQEGSWTSNLLPEARCTYEYAYTPPSSTLSPSETEFITVESPAEERNCFQDYVTRQVINLQNVRAKLQEIHDDAKFPKYTINILDDNREQVSGGEYNNLEDAVQNISITRGTSDYVFPEVANLLGKIEIILENLGRKEALLRYNTNFFYSLDDLLEAEEANTNGLTSGQQESITKMFTLFFDQNDELEDFTTTSPPRESPYEDYSELSPSYALDKLYNIEEISKLYPNELLVEDDFSRFYSPTDSPGQSYSPEQTLINRNCGDIYRNYEFLKDLQLKRYLLKEIMIGYRKNKIDINGIPIEDSLQYSPDNFRFLDASFRRLCNLAKSNLFNKLLVNYIRDDTLLFDSGEESVMTAYGNVFKQLKELEDDYSGLSFDISDLYNEKGELIDSIKDTYENLYNLFTAITNNNNMNEERIEFLANNNIVMENLSNRVNQNLDTTLNNLEIVLPPSDSYFQSSLQIFSKRDFQVGFNAFKTYHNDLTEHNQTILEHLLKTFPNANILSYIDYLRDYNRCGELDIIRKLEVVEETIKIMGEISNMVVHDGLDIGVIDFNLTDRYLYIDYLVPSPNSSQDSQIVKYDWENKASSNLIRAFNVVTVKLNKEYIDFLFEERSSEMKTLIYLDETQLPDIIPNSLTSRLEQSINVGNKIVSLFSKDVEGAPIKVMRQEFNIGREILTKYNDEFKNIYRDRPENSVPDYEVLMRSMMFNELREEINKYKFVEQGRVFVKQNEDINNKLHIYLKEYPTDKTSKQQILDYNNNVKDNLSKDVSVTTDNVRYFHDFSNQDDHPNLLSDGSVGTADDKKIYKFIPGSLCSGTGIFGMMRYNFANSLYRGNDIDRKKLSNIYFKKNVFFQIYGKQIRGVDIGPIELVNKTELAYMMSPEIKYIHGLVYTEDGKIKRSNYYGILYWFYLKQKEGKFINKDQWMEYYKTLRLEGLYNMAADPIKFKLSTNFNNQFEEYVKSLESKPNIGKLNDKMLKTLGEMKDFVYDRDLKIETYYPQIKLHRLLTKKYSNQVFVEIARFGGPEIEEKDRNVLTLVLDRNMDTNEEIRQNDGNFLDKYSSHIQDLKNNLSFNYKYYRIIKSNKFELLGDSDFCENSDRKNKFNSLWRFKIIENFKDYKEIIENDKTMDESTNRTKGLYDIHNIYRDEHYYQVIERKLNDSKDVSIQNTAKKILKEKPRNMLAGSGFPFMVVYQVRDYNGNPCQEGMKNTERIFLTFNLQDKFIFNSLEDSPRELIDQKEGPIISEEFLSYTGLGSSIRFAYQKMRGSTPLKTKDVCPSSVYDQLPGYSDNCGSGDNCGKIIVGMTRLDGVPKCALEDSEVKSKLVTPMDVSIPGNVASDACDIYKVKGNKKIKYTLGKMFGYNDAGKYQLKNQYTLKYGDYYFYYKKQGNKILFKDEFITDPEVVSNYSFNLTYGEDKYGIYILLSPQLGPKGDNTKFLTRVINIFDKHFDEWKLEKKMDSIDDPKKNYVRDNETGDKKILGEVDVDFYAQKFNLPEDVVMKIASEEGIKSELLEKLSSDMAKSNYLFCNIGGQGENTACKGNKDFRPPMTLDEENELLRQQKTQIDALIKRFDNIPKSHFDRFPQNRELMEFIKSTVTSIERASEFVYKRIKDVNWVVKTQMETNNEANRIANQTEKISDNTVSDQPMGDLVDEGGIMADALKNMSNMNFTTTEPETKQCKSIEGFSNMAPGPSTSGMRVSKFNRNISGRYYNYVKDEIDKKKQSISELNTKIHNLLSGLNQLSDGMELTGEKKQMLLSELVQERNKLEKVIFDIKNTEQQDRINRINEKLTKVEDIRSEMDEDDFRTKKPKDDNNNASMISREDGELINMYKINDNEQPDHLLFVNGGCLEYNSEKKDIKVSHCMATEPSQLFNIYRIEDKKDMDNFRLKNSDKGLDRQFDIIRTKDGKCLHKEEGQLSLRNCNNVKNQYWDYSSVTGPCNM